MFYLAQRSGKSVQLLLLKKKLTFHWCINSNMLKQFSFGLSLYKSRFKQAIVIYWASPIPKEFYPPMVQINGCFIKKYWWSVSAVEKTIRIFLSIIWAKSWLRAFGSIAEKFSINWLSEVILLSLKIMICNQDFWHWILKINIFQHLPLMFRALMHVFIYQL